MSSIEDSISIGAPVTLLEIENILKNFAKSKSLNLDEWTIDFFLQFFDLVGQYLIKVMEKS